MKKTTLSKKLLAVYLLFFIGLSTNVFAQVGIGTVTPDPSSVLEVFSTTQGMLTPRMTTAQRTAIVTPADGLIVYDTELKSFYHYNSSLTSWSRMSSDANGRLKFKRIKSTDVLATVLAAEKTAGGNTKYLLDTGTLYEMNGTIVFDLPIELNNAYVDGLDSGEDKLVKTSGDLFTGTTGGSIKGLTISVTGGGNVFNIIGPGAIGAQTQTLIFRDCIVANSSNVGKIENFSMMFMSIVQFSGNTNGIIYKDIRRLLISNVAWFGNNSGTFETLQGTFDLVQKNGGFSGVTGAAIGFDVSANPTIIADAVINEVVFAGTLTTGKYVNGYTTGSYPGFSFDNRWSVRSSGIPVEGDAVATGDVNFNYAVGSGASTTTSGTAVKLAGTTTSTNLFRFSTGATNNKLIYLGTKRRYFRTAATFSFQSSVSGAGVFIFYLAKNGVVINQSKVYCGVTSSDVDAATILSTIDMSTNDYIEVWVSRFSGSGNVLTVSLNLVVN